MNETTSINNLTSAATPDAGKGFMENPLFKDVIVTLKKGDIVEVIETRISLEFIKFSKATSNKKMKLEMKAISNPNELPMGDIFNHHVIITPH